MLNRLGKSIGSHYREMAVHYFPTKKTYAIPLYGEQLGKLINIEVKNSWIILDFDISKFKSETEYIPIEKCPSPVSTIPTGDVSGSGVTSNTSTP
jgi:hypothetical protein